MRFGWVAKDGNRPRAAWWPACSSAGLPKMETIAKCMVARGWLGCPKGTGQICMRTRGAHLDDREALAQRLSALLHDLLVDARFAIVRLDRGRGDLGDLRADLFVVRLDGRLGGHPPLVAPLLVGVPLVHVVGCHHVLAALPVCLHELVVVGFDRGRGKHRRAIVRHAIVVVGDHLEQLLGVLGRPWLLTRRVRHHLAALTAVRLAVRLAHRLAHRLALRLAHHLAHRLALRLDALTAAALTAICHAWLGGMSDGLAARGRSTTLTAAQLAALVSRRVVHSSIVAPCRTRRFIAAMVAAAAMLAAPAIRLTTLGCAALAAVRLHAAGLCIAACQRARGGLLILRPRRRLAAALWHDDVDQARRRFATRPAAFIVRLACALVNRPLTHLLITLECVATAAAARLWLRAHGGLLNRGERADEVVALACQRARHGMHERLATRPVDSRQLRLYLLRCDVGGMVRIPALAQRGGEGGGVDTWVAYDPTRQLEKVHVRERNSQPLDAIHLRLLWRSIAEPFACAFHLLVRHRRFKAYGTAQLLRVQRALLEPRLRRRKVERMVAICSRLEGLLRHAGALAEGHRSDDAALCTGAVGRLAN